MKRIGVLFGMENTFPAALVERINAMGVPGRGGRVRAGRRGPDGRARALRRDRRPHLARRAVLPRVLKNAALAGTHIINNPFWWSADDKFFNYALATSLASPFRATVLLPHKEHPPGTTDRSMRNLQYPLDWDGVFEYVGFPAFLKPFDGGGWRDVYKVDTPEEFFTAYDQTRDAVHDAAGARSTSTSTSAATSSGRTSVHIMPYDPRAPFHERYVTESAGVRSGAPRPRRARRADAVPRARLRPEHRRVRGRRRRCPYAIDFMNPGAGRRCALGRPGELRVDRRRRRRAGGAKGVAAAARRVELRWDSFLRRAP